jgi:hypothetical protein
MPWKGEEAMHSGQFSVRLSQLEKHGNTPRLHSSSVVKAREVNTLGLLPELGESQNKYDMFIASGKAEESKTKTMCVCTRGEG